MIILEAKTLFAKPIHYRVTEIVTISVKRWRKLINTFSSY